MNEKIQKEISEEQRLRRRKRLLRERRRKLRRTKIMQSVPFFVCLCVLTVIAWILPIRPSVSYSENRNLAVFPDFSVSELLDGTYFEKIDFWFSDTFPFREQWMDLGKRLESLYGKSSIGLVGDITRNDVLTAVTPAPEDISDEDAQQDEQTESAEEEQTQQDTDVISEHAQENTENRNATENDTVNEAENNDAAENTEVPVAAVSEEDSIQQNEPEAVEQGGVNLDDIDGDNAIAFNGSMVILEGSAYPITKASEYYSDMFISTVNHTAEMLDGKARLFVTFPVQSSTAMLSRDLREYIGCAIDEDTIDFLSSQFDERVCTVNPIPELRAHNSEYIYFNSDHHWTALGAYYAYTAWAKAAGVEPVPLEDFEEVDTGGFTGTFYTYRTNNHPINTDEVFYYNPPGDIHLYICDKGMGDAKEYLGYEQKLMTPIAGNGTGKYSVFLAGDHAMCTLVNNDIEDDSSVLIYKDSYGNPYGYYFTQHYKYVYLLDYRYYSNRNMAYFVDYYGIDDVIIAINMNMTQSDAGNLYFRAFTRNTN